MDGGPACSNITSTGERRRRLSGWAALLAGGIVVAVLAWRGAAPAAYAVVFPFALGAALGLLQARAHTCVALGLRGLAEVEGGGLRRLERDERSVTRAASRRVLWKSVALAAAITLALVIVSGLELTAR